MLEKYQKKATHIYRDYMIVNWIRMAELAFENLADDISGEIKQTAKNYSDDAFLASYLKLYPKNSFEKEKLKKFVANGLVYLEWLNEIFEEQEYPLTGVFVLYAIKNFILSSRPDESIIDKEEGLLQRQLNLIDEKIRIPLKISYENLSLEEIALLNFNHISLSDEDYLKKNNIAIVESDCLVKYSPNSNEIYKLEKNSCSKPDIVKIKITEGQNDPKIIATWVTACSVLIFQDTVTKDIYFTHMHPIVSFGKKYQNWLGEAIKNKIDDHKVSFISVETAGDYNLPEIIPDEQIKKKKEISMLDFLPNGFRVDVILLPKEGKICLQYTQAGAPEDIPNFGKSRLIDIKEHLDLQFQESESSKSKLSVK